MVFTDDNNVLDKSINTVKKNKETVLVGRLVLK
jgi:hypothetical protein